MFRTAEGSTARLIHLCLGYFVFYVITGITVKYFLGSADQGLPGMSGVEFLVYSTAGGTALAVGVVLVRRWYRFTSQNPVRIGPWTVPGEVLYIIPSGVCTAVVIPTTTLMYTLPISVMVAMVIMRGSVIVISRVVDAIQIRQGLLHKTVYREENLAVVFALAAVAVKMVFRREGGFDFVGSPIAMTILGSYITAYALRIYIMNYYKNTRAKGQRQNNKAFFGVEQIAATMTLVVAAVCVYNAPAWFGASGTVVDDFRGAINEPLPRWSGAVVAGMAFGVVAFFSVFLFMFRGRTATFAGLVNRLTSLIAGTVSTLLFAVGWGGRMPAKEDWVALACILIAVAFLSVAERKRTAELRETHELDVAEGTA